MKKTFFQILLLLSSCDINNFNDSNFQKTTYIQNKKTLKCYAKTGFDERTVFKCVPCDSLVMVQINKIK